MVLFAVNAGMRDSNVCGLQWLWEVPVAEIGRSLFEFPPEAFKSKKAHVVILNNVVWSILQIQRGKHPIWVFPYRGKSIRKLNNNRWQDARRAAGLTSLRIHDLRHTYGARFAGRWRFGRGPRRTAGSRVSIDAGVLCESRHWPSDQPCESRDGARLNRDHRKLGMEGCWPAEPVDK